MMSVKVYHPLDELIRIPTDPPLRGTCICSTREYNALIQAGYRPVMNDIWGQRTPAPCDCDACPERLVLRAIVDNIHATDDLDAIRPFYRGGDLEDVMVTIIDYLAELDAASEQCPVNGREAIRQWRERLPGEESHRWANLCRQDKVRIMQWTNRWKMAGNIRPPPWPMALPVVCKCWHHHPSTSLGHDVSKDFLDCDYSTHETAADSLKRALQFDEAVDRIKKALWERFEDIDDTYGLGWDRTRPTPSRKKRKLNHMVKIWSDGVVESAVPFTDEQVDAMWARNVNGEDFEQDLNGLAPIEDDEFPDSASVSGRKRRAVSDVRDRTSRDIAFVENSLLHMHLSEVRPPFTPIEDNIAQKGIEHTEKCLAEPTIPRGTSPTEYPIMMDYSDHQGSEVFVFQGSTAVGTPQITEQAKDETRA